MKPRRLSMLAAAGVMTAGALIGGTGAGEASAASYTYLCNSYSLCLYAAGQYHAEAVFPGNTSIAETNWYYPNSVNDPASYIQQANAKLCLQVDASVPYDSTVGGFLVRGAPCVGDEAEQWDNVYDSKSHRTHFVSAWGLDNGKGSLCLESNNGPLWVLPCLDGDVFEGWGTS